MKLRADLLLVQQNLVSSRTRAQALIMAGKVFSSKGRVDKSGDVFEEDEPLRVEEDMKYVSRGGDKLESAVKILQISSQDKVCLDVGASTGGFTDFLLQRGAKKVYAIDVGYGQLHYKLRDDPRVVMMEKINFRHFDTETLPEKADLAVADVSFISLTKILENLHNAIKEEGEALVMVKPQFELSPGEVKKGVVRSESLREKAVSTVTEFAQKIGFTVLGKAPSAVHGPKGNQEVFLHLKKKKLAGLLLIVLAMCLGSGCAKRTSMKSHTPIAVSEKQDSVYYFILSELDYRRNQFPQSLSNLDRAIERAEKEHVSEGYLRFKRAYLSASLNDLKKAEEDARRALEISPHEVSYLVLMGKIYHGQQKWDQAIPYYEDALKSDPSESEAHSLLIEAFLAKKDYQKALLQARSWEKVETDNMVPFFYEASIQQSFLSHPEEAIKVYQKILKEEPDNLKALAALADLYVEKKDEKKLLETFHLMEEIVPNDPSIKIKMALIFYENKDYELAIEKFEELKKISPHDDRVVYYLAVMKENTKHLNEAYPLFESLPEKSAFFRDARLHMVFIQRENGDDVAAMKLLEENRKLLEKEAAFSQYLAEIYRDHGDFKKALSILESAVKRIEKDPQRRNKEDHSALLYSYGITLDKQGSYQEAIQKMMKILEFEPQNAGALNYIGYTYADQNINLDLALEYAEKAMAQKPGDGYILDSLGWVYFKRGDTSHALELIQKALQKVPVEPTIFEHLGDIYVKKDDRLKAYQYYRKSLDILEENEKRSKGNILGEDKDRERIRQKIEKVSN